MHEKFKTIILKNENQIQFVLLLTTENMKKMLTQELNEEYLLILRERLDFEITLRSMSYDQKPEENQWMQPMFLIPMWNILEKIKKFTQYFNELNVIFPFEEVYRQPIDFSTLFHADLIHTAEEELIFKGKKIKVSYNYIM